MLLDKEVQELGEHNGTVSSSHCQVIAALLFPRLQLQSICPVIEEEDLCLLCVLGDPQLGRPLGPHSFAGNDKDLAFRPFVGGFAVIAVGAFLFNFK